MAFTNNRNVFYNNKSFDEKLFANGLGMGTPSFVCKGLELTGTTLTSGVFNNTGAFGILGLEGETHTIPANYTGFIVIKTTLNSQNGFNEIILEDEKLDTDQRDASNIKHFTIYELLNGVIIQDLRHINYVKSFELVNLGGSLIAWKLNGFTSEPFDASVLAGNRTVVSLFDLGIVDADFTTLTGRDIFGHVHQEAITDIGNDKPIIIRQRIDNVDSYPILHGKLSTEALDNTGVNLEDISVFEYNINVSGSGSNAFTGNQHYFTITSPVKNGSDFSGNVDADDVYNWSGEEEVNINAHELVIAPNGGQNFYFDRAIRREEPIKTVGWVDAPCYIGQINGVAVSNAILGANSQNIDGTWDTFYTETGMTQLYIAPFVDHWSTFDASLFSGFGNNLCIKGEAQLEASGAATIQHVGHSARSEVLYNTISSIRINVNSTGTYGLTGVLTINTHRKIKVSTIPFTLFQLLQSNDNEIANIIYNNQFVSEAQKQEFEENGTSELFYALGTPELLEAPVIETPNVAPKIDNPMRGGN